MAQPILSIDDSNSRKGATANLLPCQLTYNGQIPLPASLWISTQEPDDARKAYFRGRKLKGKVLPIPENHKGFVVERKNEAPAQIPDIIAEDEIEPDQAKMKVITQFDEVVVWDHEALADSDSNEYVRGMEEWISLSNKMHSFDQRGDGGQESTSL